MRLSILGATSVSISLGFGYGTFKGIFRRKMKFSNFSFFAVLLSSYGLVSGGRWFLEKELTKGVLNEVDFDDEKILEILELDNEIHTDHLKGNLFR